MRCNQTADVRVIIGYPRIWRDCGEIAFKLPSTACACAANTKSTSENHMLKGQAGHLLADIISDFKRAV